MVTSPAWGMPAAPTLAAVAVMLQMRRVGDTGGKREQEIRGPGREGHLKLNAQTNTESKVIHDLALDMKLKLKCCSHQSKTIRNHDAGQIDWEMGNVCQNQRDV